MTGRSVIGGSLIALACVAGAPAGHAAQAPQSTAAAQTGTLDLLLDQGKRLFDAFQYDEAVQLFDRLITTIAAGQTPRPDLLVQVYELRARSRFALGDTPGTEQDFAALLAIKPDFTLAADVSPRVVAVLDGVRRVTVGQVMISLTPPGDVQIDGRTYAVAAEPVTLDLTAGDHQLSATRPSYSQVSQTFTVTAGEVSTLTITLERVSASLSVVTVPDAVDVLFDGTPRGTTQRGAGSTLASAPLVLNDLPPGSHRLTFRRDCYVPVERAVTLAPEDLALDPIQLTPAVANIRVEAPQASASLFVDGTARGQAPADLALCEGTHVIEVRGPSGRFLDRRDWKTGDKTTLMAELRSAFPIVVSRGGAATTTEQLGTSVERALAGAKKVMLYVPVASDLQAALRDNNVPPDWLTANLVEGSTAAGIPPEVTRDLGRRLSTALGAQGVAAVVAAQDGLTVSVSLLAAGSAEPDVVTMNMADPASQASAAARLGAPLPPIMRPSLETSVVDVAGVQGAVVIAPGGAGAKAGLAVGDTITSAGGKPVASVADLDARIDAATPASTTLLMDVAGPNGTARKVTATLAMVPDTLPMRDPGILYNRALLELRETATTASSPLVTSAASLNLAIVQMRLSNWDEALAALKTAELPDGVGVSAGTIAYLTGLCQEATGRTADARSSFTKAAAATGARLWSDGPLVAPLARLKLAGRR
jgi:PDZ domain/PEGA domain